MPRHPDKGTAQLIHVDREASGGLRRIQDKGHSSAPAQFRHPRHRQDIAEHVGDVGADDARYLRRELLGKGFQHGVRPEQRGPGGLDAAAQGGQRTGDGVVLVAGDHHRIPGLYHGFDGQIQRMGGIEGKDHVSGVLQMKEFGGCLSAGKGRISRQHGRFVPAPPGACHMLHGIGDGPPDRGRFLQGGGRAVQIDHQSSTSL